MASLYKKSVTRIDPRTGKETKAKSAKWWIKYRDADGIVRRVPGYTDKAATQQEAARLKRQAELGQAGFETPRQASRTSLAEHLADFERHLGDKGNTEDQVKLVTSRVRKALEGCKFRVIEDVSPSKVEAFLAGLRKERSFHPDKQSLSTVDQAIHAMARPGPSAQRQRADPPIHDERGNRSEAGASSSDGGGIWEAHRVG